jgi:monoamine oxidase
VHFAGADFAYGWRGFIDGAIESGARSAQIITDKLKKLKTERKT